MRMAKAGSIAAILLSLAAVDALARDVADVKVLEIYADKAIGNVVFVRLNASPANSGCVTNATWHYTLDLNTAVGKTMYSQLLVAVTSGASVFIYGTNLCNEYGNVETMSGVRLFSS